MINILSGIIMRAEIEVTKPQRPDVSNVQIGIVEVDIISLNNN